MFLLALFSFTPKTKKNKTLLFVFVAVSFEIGFYSRIVWYILLEIKRQQVTIVILICLLHSSGLWISVPQRATCNFPDQNINYQQSPWMATLSKRLAPFEPQVGLKPLPAKLQAELIYTIDRYRCWKIVGSRKYLNQLLYSAVTKVSPDQK